MTAYLASLRRRHLSALQRPWPSDPRKAQGDPLPAATLALLMLAVAGMLLAGRGYHAGFAALNGFASWLPDDVLAVLTYCGDSLLPLVLLAPLARRHPRLVWLAVVAALLATALSHGVKLWVDAPRPPAVLDAGSFRQVGQAYRRGSFPSGHSVTAFVTAGVFAAYLPRLWIRTALLLAAAAVAWSRVAVGVHWPVDIAVGAAIGLGSVSLGVWIVERYGAGLRFWPYQAQVLLLAGCCVAALLVQAPYPQATPLLHLAALGGLASLLLDFVVLPAWDAGLLQRSRPRSLVSAAPGAAAASPVAVSPPAAAGRRVLVTGCAGFIGFHACQRLLQRGDQVLGIDNLNGYYDPQLKRARLDQLTPSPGFRFQRLDLADAAAMAALFAAERFDVVLHLGAQAGVRHSLEAPQSYVDSNISGTLNVLEGCRRQGVAHLVYASSSSVYGAAGGQACAETDRTDAPVSLYAATKKSCELICHAYAQLYSLPSTGLRLFTVYGPWGRPDMAYFKFADAILAGRPIDLYNHGEMQRDFTYIDDVVDGIERVLPLPPQAGTGVPHRVLNLGHHRPEPVIRLVELLERSLGRRAELRLLPMQPGDVKTTCADTEFSARLLGWRARVTLDQGIAAFARWYLDYRMPPSPAAPMTLEKLDA